MSETSAPQSSSPHLSPDDHRALRVGAYVLIGDPAHLVQSVRSYYDLVDEVVAVYDGDGLGWAGRPLPIEQCLDALEPIDTAGKVRHLTGDFHRPDGAPLELETAERNTAIASFGGRVDWVLQIDSDEVVANPDRLLESVVHADTSGRCALEYPARWLYGHVGGERYLERCRRGWGVSAGYPGAVAVRAGTVLSLARQCDVPTWRVDFRGRNTDPAHPPDAPVDEQVAPDDAIWHFSWVRSEAELREKAAISGHADEFDWNAEIDLWLARCRHPRLTSLLTPIRRHPPTVGAPTWLRTTRVPGRLTAPAR